MLSSMTGFSRVSRIQGSDQIIWECRSVNHRYLDMSLRVPEAFSAFEGEYRERVQAKLTRGKIVCELSVIPIASSARSFDVDEGLVLSFIEASEKIRSLTKLPSIIELRDILKWPGVLKETHLNVAAVAPLALELLDKAIEELADNRRREGQKLQTILHDKLSEIDSACQEIRQAIPELNAHFRERLLMKLKDLAVEVDPNRFEQELILHLNRADIEEELDRLQAHISEARDVFKNPGSVGRRLDFLMQEFNREVNTIGSKSVGIQVTQSAVSMKVWIEQMREQVQNIE